MGYIQEELAKRNIPDFLVFNDGTPVTDKADWEKRRKEIIDLLANEMYGHIPPAFPFTIEEKVFSDKHLGRKLDYSQNILKFDTPYGHGEFTFHTFFPHGKTNVPTFIFMAFKPNEPWNYCPVESIIDRGYGVIMAYHAEISSDDGDFTNGIASALPREVYNCGKISLWSWAATRLMDYAQTLDFVDKTKIAMIGHSRLGKTTLWTVANDTRFSFACANCSGCSGDALARDTVGETVEKIYNRFPYWFVPAYEKYKNNESSMPFDQHFLLASIAPRKVCTAAAVLDAWADPHAQFLSCNAASPAYELLGLKGIVCEDRPTVPGDTYHEGNIGHHLRHHGHTLSLYDWNKYMDFIDKN